MTTPLNDKFPTPTELTSGPYIPPDCRVGWWLAGYVLLPDDAVLLNGPHQVLGWTDAPLSWPWTRTEGSKRRQIIMTDAIERLIRMESGVAASRWLGRSTWWCSRARHAFQVPRMNPGTTELWRWFAGTPAQLLKPPRRTVPTRYLDHHDVLMILEAVRLGMPMAEAEAKYGVTAEWLKRNRKIKK